MHLTLLSVSAESIGGDRSQSNCLLDFTVFITFAFSFDETEIHHLRCAVEVVLLGDHSSRFLSKPAKTLLPDCKAKHLSGAVSVALKLPRFIDKD